MASRLIEIFVPEHARERLEGAVKKSEAAHAWLGSYENGACFARLLVDAEVVESVLEVVQSELTGVDDLRIAVLPVEVVLPLPEVEEASEPEGPPPESEGERHARISREELYADVHDAAKLDWVYVATVVLSTIVAVVGLLRSDVAVIIGAMVIAPLLGPNIGLAFATTLGDLAMVRRSLAAIGAGVALALVVSVALGVVLPVDPHAPALAARATVSLGDVALALAAGVAGALAFTTGVSGALIGVMVAVALLPPLVSMGLFFGAGDLKLGAGAALLVSVNVIAINLAAVSTFVLQGIRPRTWWEADRAHRATRNALLIWGGLLLLLVVALLVAGRI